jgi:ElaB/YqjD/DUF883 family membrane-anchored ribosome-binding protein
MGKKSDELQREIREHRAYLDRKLDRVDERVRSDVERSRQTVDADLRERLHLDRYAEERPFLTLAVAFGTGFALGAVTPAVPAPSMPSMARSEGRGSRGDGALGSLLGMLSGSLGSTITDEVREMFRQATGDRQDTETSGDRTDGGAVRYEGHEEFERRADEFRR